MKFGEAAAQLLATYGVDTIFGIPGVHTIELYRGLPAAGIASHPARHEQGVGFMADAYARRTGRPGVCVLVTGPGALNALTPVAQAWHDSIPLLVIAAATRTDLAGRRRGPLHDIHDQVGALAAVAGASYLVTRPQDFPDILAQAWQQMTGGRPQPVAISIPTDVLDLEVDGPFTRHIAPNDAVSTPGGDEIEAAGRILQDSTRPVLLIGGGARAAGSVVRELAEYLDAPVINTGNAAGVMDGDHPLSVGTLLPFAGARTLLTQADVVLAVGTEFSETDVIYTGQQVEIPGALIRIDIDPDQLNVPRPASVAIAGDAHASMTALVQRLRSTGVPERAGGDGARRASAAREDVEWTAQSRGHMPWLDALTETLPLNATVVLDSTQLAYTAHHYVAQRTDRPWIATYGLGTLGAAVPMAVGAAIAEPDRPVLAIAGDGGSLFTLTELASAHDLGRQFTLLLWDNGGYGEIRDSFDRAGAQRIDTEVSAYDLVTIAQGFGAHAERVKSPDDLRTALQAAFSRAALTVVVAESGPA